MSSNSLITKSVILVSALVGGVVGMLELSDRFMVSSTVTETETEPEDGSVMLSGAGAISDRVTRVEDEKRLQAEEKVVASRNAALGSDLEQELAARIAEQLARLDCVEVTVDQVAAVARVVPREETSHGFEGHTLEGAVVLQGAGGPERVRLAGSGKGATGAIGAMDMALRKFDEHVTKAEIYKKNCQGD